MFDNQIIYFFYYLSQDKVYKVYTITHIMHLYTLTRGIKNRMNEWENDLSAQWMPLNFKLPDGSIKEGRVKLAIREVKLHEIVFPKEYEEAVMGLINPAVDIKSGYMGKWGKLVPKLARFLGLNKPMKKWKPSNLINADGISCLALGTKEDIMNFDISESVQSHGVTPQENL